MVRQSNAIAHSLRRRLSFSLRTLLIAVTAVAIVLSVKIRESVLQKQAVATLQGKGVVISQQYDFQREYYDGKKGLPPESAWPAKLFGVDAWHNVTKVQLIESNFESKDLKRALAAVKHLPQLDFLQVYGPNSSLVADDFKSLASLEYLQDLYLYQNGIDDEGIASVAGLSRLKALRLFENRITEAGLKNFARLTQLETLDLSDNQIAGDSLDALSHLQMLVDLELDRNRITDAGLAHFSKLKNLRTLGLTGNRLTGSGLKHLAGLSNLRQIVLDDNPITDESLTFLLAIHPHVISLARTSITDAGLKTLAQLPKECDLCITGTAITDEGITWLQAQRPASGIYVLGDFSTGSTPSLFKAIPEPGSTDDTPLSDEAVTQP